MVRKISAVRYFILPQCGAVQGFRGDGTNSFPIDLNTNILENTSPFLRIAATLVYRTFELFNSKFKQAKKNNMLCCILDSCVNSYPTTVCGTAFS